MIKITIRRCRTTLAVAALGACAALYTGCTLNVDDPSDEDVAALEAESELAQPEQVGGGQDSELATEDAIEPVAEGAVDDGADGLDPALSLARPSGVDTDPIANHHQHPGTPQAL
jgi:hypothetical protein